MSKTQGKNRPRLETPASVTLDTSKWRIMDVITTFWLPTYLLLSLGSTNRASCDTHFAIFILLSGTAVACYRLHRMLRPIGGILRWVGMPIVIMHALLHNEATFLFWSRLFIAFRAIQVCNFVNQVFRF
jgi:hypothetical protein